MIQFSLPRETFHILEETFGSREKAEVFAMTMEEFLSQIDDRARQTMGDRLENIRLQIKEDLVGVLVTREQFDERFQGLNERFQGINERFQGINEHFQEINERFNRIDERFASIEHSFNGQIKSLKDSLNERFKSIDERFRLHEDNVNEKFKNQGFKLSILIGLAIAALTLANPAFVKLIEKLF